MYNNYNNRWISKDIFNSSVFSLEMWNINIDKYDGLNLKEELKKHINSYKVDHLSCKVRSGQKHEEIIKEIGFELVSSQVIYLLKPECNQFITRPSTSEGNRIRFAKEGDLNRLQEISNKSFKNTRYFNDKNLDNTMCKVYYEKWITNLFYQQNDGTSKILVITDDNDNVSSFIAYVINEDRQEIVIRLNATDDNSRNKGHYTALLERLISSYPKYTIIAGTQESNKIQNIWKRFNFEKNEEFKVYHKYYEGVKND